MLFSSPLECLQPLACSKTFSNTLEISFHHHLLQYLSANLSSVAVLMSFLKAFPGEWLVARADQTLLTLANLPHRPGFAANQQAPDVTAAARHHAAMTTCHKTQEVLLILSGPCITVSANCQANKFLQSADGPDHACHRAFCVTCQSCMSSHHACV